MCRGTKRAGRTGQGKEDPRSTQYLAEFKSMVDRGHGNAVHHTYRAYSAAARASFRLTSVTVAERETSVHRP